MSPTHAHSSDEIDRIPLSPAARWVAAAVLGVIGTVGVTRGLVGPPPMRLGATTVVLDSGRAAPALAGAPRGQGRAGPSVPGGVARTIDLNSASAAELDLLPSIGPTLAARIIADREAHGPFGSLADLDRVPGIGPKTVAKLAPYASAD